uniref:Pentatricopeptide repeat-containing protein n=1 Tax=Oryza meridionalis TaxID=40149 RepID=A0A0E0DPR3_9ORYZ
MAVVDDVFGSKLRRQRGDPGRGAAPRGGAALDLGTIWTTIRGEDRCLGGSSRCCFTGAPAAERDQRIAPRFDDPHLLGVYCLCVVVLLRLQAPLQMLLPSSPSSSSTPTSFPYNHFLSKHLSLFTSSFSSTTTHSAAADYVLLLLASHPAPTAFSYNVAIRFFASSHDPGAARKMFDGIPSRDVVSLNAMMKAYGRVEMNGEVGRMFRDMVKDGAVVPNAMTLAVMLAACRDEGDLVLGRWVEEWSKSAGMETGSLVGSALVGMHDKCGEIAEARRVFDSIIDKDVVAWNAMITGYAQNGMSNEAISLFHSMRKAGVCPDKITLAGVLSACSAVGALELGSELDGYASCRGLYSNAYVGTALVDMYSKCGDLDKAIEVFRKMRCKNIIPKIEHYSCMVDLLARSGHLEEAWDFIEKIPDKVDAVMLGALLAACRKCKNVEIGERVINRIIQLEPTNSWNYVVSSKIYASSDRLDDSAKMRGLMRERGVNKTPGCSWVEISGKVLEFYVGDEPQHGADDMYQVLDLLVDEMRLEGYVPNLDVNGITVEEILGTIIQESDSRLPPGYINLTRSHIGANAITTNCSI